MRKLLLITLAAVVAYSIMHFTRLERLDATATTIVNTATMVNTPDLWQGTWHSFKTDKKGDFRVNLKQAGTDLSGSVEIGGSPVTRGGEIRGTINGNTLEFGLVKDKRGELKYLGTISDNKMYGTWQIPILKDRGTWQATKAGSVDS
ncbi:MAG: hypothetical protein NG740_04445 [Omnitrophica bacterium]|nr:hypothetical protein [Candidatus Omnitrophota bacterium]